MPNVWAHLIFGGQVLEALDEHSLIERPEHRKLFHWGCQGPDFLFYHQFVPWRKSRAMNALGAGMHRTHCGKVLMDMLDIVSGRAMTGPDPDPAPLYALGFALHHVLDRNLHPYVHSRAGFGKWDHQRFEIMLDTLLVRELLQLDTWRTPVWRELDTRSGLPEAIVDAFEQTTACHYPALAPLIEREDWERARTDMLRAQRLFHDPTGLRRLLTLGRIEPFVYKKQLPELDFLNIARRPWIDPVDDTAYHDDSVWMLWDNAIRDGAEVARAVLSWLRAEHRQAAGDRLRSSAAAEVAAAAAAE
ncbi:zinc dependent phospholipase C family protein, partial [Paenibacillus sp. IB182496]